MAGHSKWANIKHRKAAQDKKRGKLYTKLIREITVAARLGGGVVDDNPRLRAAVDKSLGANMPKDTIERAIARGAGGVDGNDVEELVYEGYASGGVAVLVEVMTDNRNRTVAEVRHAFSKYGGNLGTDGSVAYLFDRKGQILFEPGTNEDDVMEIAIEFGADDVETEDDGSISVSTAADDYMAVKDALVAGGLEPAASEVAMIPQNYSELNVDMGEKVLRLVDALEDLDDVTNVYTNANFPDELMG